MILVLQDIRSKLQARLETHVKPCDACMHRTRGEAREEHNQIMPLPHGATAKCPSILERESCCASFELQIAPCPSRYCNGYADASGKLRHLVKVHVKICKPCSALTHLSLAS